MSARRKCDGGAGADLTHSVVDSLSLVLSLQEQAGQSAKQRYAGVLAWKGRVAARGGEIEIDELKERLDVFGRAATRKTLPEGADDRTDARFFAGQRLLQGDEVESSHPVLSYHGRSGGCRAG